MKVDTISFSADELHRYSRHLILPQFGMAGQQKLKASKILVIGSGGLGSPVLLYLAAAGVGTIGIVDFDVVDKSNLQRQVLFGLSALGQPKAEAAKERLQDLNDNIHFQVFTEKLSAANAMEIINDFELVIDGTDNFATRYLVNDACVLCGKPLVYGSVFRFEGQVSLFNYKDANGNRGPNYRDLYPTPPAPDAVLSCGEGGVLGVLPGIIGSMQALEAIKAITGIGTTLSGFLVYYDALTNDTKKFALQHNEDNPLTGKAPTITSLIDYEAFCGVKKRNSADIKKISPADLHALQNSDEDFELIDVREPYEYEIVNIGGRLMPLKTIAQHQHQIPKNKKVIVHCKGGTRSAEAIDMLQNTFGFENLYNLSGGILAYIDAYQPNLNRY